MCTHSKIQVLGLMKKWFWQQNELVKWGNQPLGEQFELINYSGHFMRQNDYYEPQNCESLMAISSTTQKQISWAWKMRKMAGKREGYNPTTEHYQIDLPAMGIMRKTTKNVNANTHKAPAS